MKVMKRNIAAVALLLLVTGSANAALIENSGEVTGAAGLWAYSPIGQSFIANGSELQSIAFSFVQVSVSPPGNGLVTMDLYSGSGFGGTLLGSQTLFIDSSSLPEDGANFIGFDFTGITLAIGQTYTAGVSSSDQKIFVERGGNTYAGGQLFETPLYVPSYGCDPSSLCDLHFQVTTVPVPAAFWLFGSALGVMGVVRRKVRTGTA
jgi:hypothetical protein